MAEQVPSSPTGGYKPMTIAGRMVRERERCRGMTPEERAWRAQWLKDQVLTAREPVYVKEYHDAIRNPIRRFYTAPLNALGRYMTPKLVSTWAKSVIPISMLCNRVRFGHDVCLNNHMKITKFAFHLFWLIFECFVCFLEGRRNGIGGTPHYWKEYHWYHWHLCRLLLFQVQCKRKFKMKTNHMAIGGLHSNAFLLFHL